MVSSGEERKIVELILFSYSVRKLVILLLIGAAGLVKPQDVTIECRFETNFWNEYTCYLQDIEIPGDTQNVIITGTHEQGRTNDDVLVVSISQSNTPFIIQELFVDFINMLELEVDDSNLQSIRLPSTENLIYLSLFNNNISRIENGSFGYQAQLSYIWAISCNIQEIDEDALLGLENLSGFVLIDNRISQLAPRTLHPLANAGTIDLERNLLTRIEEETFSENRALFVLYLEYNQINEISPRFAVNLNDLFFVNFFGNQCASEYFYLLEEEDWDRLNSALRPCFDNFEGTGNERQITMEFSGSMTISDEFGNVIARI